MTDKVTMGSSSYGADSSDDDCEILAKLYDCEIFEESSVSTVLYSTCNICYRNLKTRCFPNNCIHKFCYKCSEEILNMPGKNPGKRECPVCKILFMHIIRAPVPWTDDDWKIVADFGWRSLSDNFRKKVYDQNLWAEDMNFHSSADYKEFTPQFYKDNPSETQRLVRWLEREINILSDFIRPEITYDHMIQSILNLLSQHSIRSNEFKSAILPFFGTKTDHFVHEFYTFANSFYDIHSFDDHAFYHATAEDNQVQKFNLYLDVIEKYNEVCGD